MFATQLKTRVRERQLTLGPLMTNDFWPGYLEIFKAEQMDFAIVDCEHSSASLRDVEELCRTARLLDFPVLIRPESCVYHLVRKYVDMGPAGLMLPWMETAQQIEAARNGAFLPPLGRRGPGGPSIAANRSLDREGWDEIEQSLFVMIQIESPAGLAALPDLARQDWIDAVMLGPYDMSLNLGRHGQMSHPEVVSAIEQVYAGAAQAGKPCGMVIGTPDQAAFWMERGFRFLITSEVTVLARMQARHLVQSIRQRLPK